MFVYNIKVNGNKVFKILFLIIILILIIFFIKMSCTIFGNSKRLKTNDSISKQEVVLMNSNNYTNILKTVHDNLDTYNGQKIDCTGYIYRVYDFNDNEFVLARDMIINSNLQTLVVGFLCKYDNIKEFDDRTWVNIKGEITKGTYHGDIPILKILEIKKIDKPKDEYVYPPDDAYLPTSILF